MVSIFVAEDHQMVRQGIRLLLEAERDFHCVGESGDGLETLRLIEKIHPDILLLDLVLPTLHGLEVIRQIRKKKLAVRILVLSMHSDEVSIIEALSCGADGYVLKSSSSRDLIGGIRHVVAGKNDWERWLPGPVAQKRPRPVRRAALYDTLSDRERIVLQLNAGGNTNAQVGKRLFISPRTAETHRRNLMQKLHLHSQTDLVRYAIRNKLITA